MAKLTKKAKPDTSKKAVLVQTQPRTEAPGRFPTADLSVQRPSAGQQIAQAQSAPPAAQQTWSTTGPGPSSAIAARSSLSLSSSSYRGVSASPAPVVAQDPPPIRYSYEVRHSSQPNVASAGRYCPESVLDPVAVAQPLRSNPVPRKSLPASVLAAREQSRARDSVNPAVAHHQPTRHYDARLQPPRPDVAGAGRHRSESALSPNAMVTCVDGGNGPRVGGYRSVSDPALTMPVNFQVGRQTRESHGGVARPPAAEPPPKQQRHPSEVTNTEQDVDLSGPRNSLLRVVNPDQAADNMSGALPEASLKSGTPLFDVPESLRVPGYFQETPVERAEMVPRSTASISPLSAVETVELDGNAKGPAVPAKVPIGQSPGTFELPTTERSFTFELSAAEDTDPLSIGEPQNWKSGYAGSIQETVFHTNFDPPELQVAEQTYDGSGWGLETETMDPKIPPPTKDETHELDAPDGQAQHVDRKARQIDARDALPSHRLGHPDTVEAHNERIKRYLSEHHAISQPSEGLDWTGTLLRTLQDTQQQAHALSMRCTAGETRFAALTRQIRDRDDEILRLREEHAASVRDSEQRMRELQNSIEGRMTRMAANHAELRNRQEQQWVAARADLQSRITQLEGETRIAHIDRSGLEVANVPDKAIELSFQNISQKLGNLVGCVPRPDRLDRDLDPTDFLGRHSSRKSWTKFVRSVCWGVIIRGFFQYPLGFGALGSQGPGFEVMYPLYQMFAWPGPNGRLVLPNDPNFNVWRARLFSTLFRDINEPSSGKEKALVSMYRTNADTVIRSLIGTLQHLANGALDPAAAEPQVVSIVHDLGMMALQLGSQRAHVLLETCQHGDRLVLGERFGFEEKEFAPSGFGFDGAQVQVDLNARPCIRRIGDGREDLTTEVVIAKGEVVTVVTRKVPVGSIPGYG